MNLYKALLRVAVLIVISAADCAWAQTTTSATSTTSSENSELSDVIVTARRQEERLQDVPTEVVAFDQKALTEKAIFAPYDLGKYVPGLTVDAGIGNPGTPQFSIRGRGLNYGAAAGSVETYFADVPLSGPFEMPTLPPQFFDLASLQVLKGPQGTLFGRSTTGGAVAIVPQAPTNEFGGYARLQGGDYGDFQGEGAINIPLVTDKAALRIAVFDWQRDGYMYTNPGTRDAVTGALLGAQTYANIDTREARTTLRLSPTDNFENTTLFTYHWDQERNSNSPGLNTIGLGSPNGLGAFYTPGYGTRYMSTDVDLTKPPTKVWAVINTTKYDLPSNLTLKNIFGYINAVGYTNDGADADGTAIPAAAIDLEVPPRPRVNDQYTEELQLQGHNFFDDRLTWVVGGLIDKTREPGAPNEINYDNVIYQFGALDSLFEQNTINSYGIYFSGTYKLTDTLNLSAGYRHSWDDVQLVTADLPGLVIAPNPADLLHYQSNLQGNAGNISLDYHVSTQTMLYGGYRRGYKHGGFNVSAVNPSLTSYNPETVDDFFVGLKTDFNVAHMPMRFNIEAYYDLYQNLQASYMTIQGSYGFTAITTNIPKTTFRGFDADLAAEVTDWLMVSGNYSLIDAYNTKWPDSTLAGVSADLTGNPVPFAVRNKVALTTRFHHELPNALGELALAPSVSSQSRYYTTPTAYQLPAATAAVLHQINMAALGGAYVPGYTVFDLRAEWNHIAGSKIDAAINVSNLTNKFYYLGNNGTLLYGVETNAYAPPRMINAEISTKF